MKNKTILLFFSIAYCFFSCGNNETKPSKKKLSPVNSLTPVSETVSSDTPAITASIKNKTTIVNKKTRSPTQIDSTKSPEENTDIELKETDKELISFINIRKILTGAEIGETLTQKELIQNFEIPKDAVKMVKSITKTAEDEIALKWHSTWFIEKMSDAKFNDGRMKIKFIANKMYTSGEAIGIKYNRKIYNDLVIIGNSAYIPSVKGYHWQIGK
ncbi:hypothetical protein [Flavobacterium sp. N1736]|uniref:hypothetical protein n=1 Tax=Flavobacterium sp. N1736 TaxID=2986823 RepID=UPI0022243CED|nr:hypothetical protein [Flavobacterium sp. N1736]